LNYTDLVVEKEKPKQKKLLLEDELMKRLKEWRSELAKQKQVPAYVIFSDKVFENVVASKPSTTADLLNVEGIGKVKMEQYGKDILAIIQGFLASQDIVKNVKGQTYIETLDLYKEGFTPAEIAKAREMSETTIYSHLAYLYTKDEPVDIFKYVSMEEVSLVQEAWNKTGQEMALAAIAERLIAPIEFHKIRLALAVIIKSSKK
jgi:ATP-dependent DNA helicase RecQ